MKCVTSRMFTIYVTSFPFDIFDPSCLAFLFRAQQNVIAPQHDLNCKCSQVEKGRKKKFCIKNNMNAKEKLKKLKSLLHKIFPTTAYVDAWKSCIWKAMFYIRNCFVAVVLRLWILNRAWMKSCFNYHPLMFLIIQATFNFQSS